MTYRHKSSQELVEMLGDMLDDCPQRNAVESLFGAILQDLNLHQEELRSQNDEMKQVLERLEISRTMYRDLYEFAPVGYATLDTEGMIAEANLTLCTMTGRDRQGLKRMLFTSLVTDDKRLLFKRDLKRAMAGEGCMTPLTIIGPDEDPVHTLVRLAPIREASGDIQICHMYVMDVTEEQQAKEKLQESERRFRQIVAKTPSGICMTDENGYFTYVNPAYCELYGFSEDELLGRHFTIVVPEEAKAALSKLHDDFIRGSNEVRGEWQVRRKDGELLTILADASRLVGTDGKPYKATFVMDISDRIQAERLRQDIDRITRHDLRSPLSGLISLPGLLLEDPDLTPEQHSIVEMIHISGQRMLRTLDVSQAMVRMEMGSYELTPVPLNAISILKSIHDELASIASSHAVTMRILVHGHEADRQDKVLFLGEELLAHNMLANLLLNAVEASPKNSLVTVDLVVNTVLSIRIHNTGEVPEPMRINFFEKYATYGKKMGTGLGTYSALLMARAMNGDIAMQTSAAQGTTLTITLPLPA